MMNKRQAAFHSSSIPAFILSILSILLIPSFFSNSTTTEFGRGFQGKLKPGYSLSKCVYNNNFRSS
jgi:hypothetical protein